MKAFVAASVLILLLQSNARRLSDLIPDWNNVTDGLNCDNIEGLTVCNGTNNFYENSSSSLSESAIKLQRKILASNRQLSRSGYSDCSNGLDSECVVMESVLIPTYLTNSVGQPRFIYQNKHVGIVQEIRLAVCRSTECGGHPHNTCRTQLRHLMLIAINPHRPYELILDTFSVRGCCKCNIPWVYGDEFLGGGHYLKPNYPLGPRPIPGMHHSNENLDFRFRPPLTKDVRKDEYSEKEKK